MSALNLAVGHAPHLGVELGDARVRFLLALEEIRQRGGHVADLGLLVGLFLPQHRELLLELREAPVLRGEVGAQRGELGFGGDEAAVRVGELLPERGLVGAHGRLPLTER